MGNHCVHLISESESLFSKMQNYESRLNMGCTVPIKGVVERMSLTRSSMVRGLG